MKRYQGFTLIETLAATALAAIMMATIVAVVSALIRDSKLDDKETVSTQWDQDVREIIHRDLRHAEYYYSEDNVITFTGPISLNPESYKPNHQPVTVTYRVVEHAGINWLLRIQVAPDSRSLNNEWTQLMCSGVQDITISQAAESAGLNHTIESIARDPSQDNQALPRMLSLPHKSVAILITWGNQDNQVVKRTTVLR